MEQDCPYIDADNKDQVAYHIYGVDDEETMHSCARLLPSGVSYPGYASIGRVVTSSDYRGKGEGFQLMKTSIEKALELSWLPLKLSAQVYAIPFYKKLGFYSTGEEYLEDGIPHIAMIADIKTLTY